MAENTEDKVMETVEEQIEITAKDGEEIYEAQGYAAMEEGNMEDIDEENAAYFESGYMTIPDEDPDEDKRTLEYPENYEEIANRQLQILEQQYLAVVNGKPLSDDLADFTRSKKSDLLPRPIDVVGDEEDEPKKSESKKKKSGNKKKKEETKKWTREEILNSFLPPDKQGGLPKSRFAKKSKNPKDNSSKTAQPAKTEKKPVPMVIINEKKEEEKKDVNVEEKNKVIQETMQSIHFKHTPKWAKNMSEEEINELVKKAAHEIVDEYWCLLNKQFPLFTICPLSFVSSPPPLLPQGPHAFCSFFYCWYRCHSYNHSYPYPLPLPLPPSHSSHFPRSPNTASSFHEQSAQNDAPLASPTQAHPYR